MGIKATIQLVVFTAVLLVLIPVSNLAFAQGQEPSKFDFLPPYGIEVEFASEKLIKPDPKDIPDKYYKIPLEIVKAAYGDENGVIGMRDWVKVPNGGIKSAVYVDPYKREWSVTPEPVNTTGLDGFELITPPLNSEEDESRLVDILKKVLATKEYGIGTRSSVHVTLDVSHLIEKNGDVSRLVDAILFLENHWPEIYCALSPVRYGSIVNQYSVPLSAEQQDLLKELICSACFEEQF